jgi:hypothetical protein
MLKPGGSRDVTRLGHDGDRSPGEPPSAGLWTLALLLFGIGFASRVAPLLTNGNRLFAQFPSEDGYLMLTIARNLAAGLGMTTADGTIPTNGTQPLATLLWAGAFGIAGGDRELGVRLVLILELLFSSLVPVALFYLGRGVLRERAYARSASLLAGSTWYASPVGLGLSMNCLETGLYALATVLGIHAVLLLDEKCSARRLWLSGALLGAVFWVRNDAVFLIGSAGLAYVLVGGAGSREATGRRIVQATVLGLVCAAIASPWLVYNYLGFGSIVPISGSSQAMGGELGRNIVRLPAVLAQYLLVVVPISTPLEASWPNRIAGTAVVVAGVVHYRRVFQRGARAERQMLLLVAFFALALSVYYAAFFGAPYFLKRYLFPLSPLLALGAAATLCGIGEGPRVRAWRRLLPLASAALVGGLVLLVVPIYQRGDYSIHWAKWEWIQSNLREEDWVGAIQSGTIGFFHARTINLDGKVNPLALQARRLGRFPGYVIRSPIEWLVDWPEILGQLTKWPVVQEEFEVVVEDPSRRLLVLRRRGAGAGARRGGSAS